MALRWQCGKLLAPSEDESRSNKNTGLSMISLTLYLRDEPWIRSKSLYHFESLKPSLKPNLESLKSVGSETTFSKLTRRSVQTWSIFNIKDLKKTPLENQYRSSWTILENLDYSGVKEVQFMLFSHIACNSSTEHFQWMHSLLKNKTKTNKLGYLPISMQSITCNAHVKTW